jgi:hypothetical protein
LGHFRLCCLAVVAALWRAGPGHAQTLVTTLNQLQAMQYSPAASYQLGNDIDASATRGWNNGAGFVPIGNQGTPFTGSFDGGGHRIFNLYVASKGDSAGLFGTVGQHGLIRSIHLIGGSVSIADAPDAPVGGLAGINAGTIVMSSAKVSVSGQGPQNEPAGGLVGDNTGAIWFCMAGGPVAGADSGGLVGDNGQTGEIGESVATGRVLGGIGGYRAAGGFVGNNGGSIFRSFASGAAGAIMGRVGGFAGVSTGEISYAYALGAVQGYGGQMGQHYLAGGFAGENAGVLKQVYSTGLVGGRGYVVGGLVADASLDGTGTAAFGYWDVQTSRVIHSVEGTALGTALLTAKLPPGFSPRLWVSHKGSFPKLAGVTQ